MPERDPSGAGPGVPPRARPATRVAGQLQRPAIEGRDQARRSDALIHSLHYSSRLPSRPSRLRGPSSAYFAATAGWVGAPDEAVPPVLADWVGSADLPPGPAAV